MEIKKVKNPANQVMADRVSVRNYNKSHKMSREVIKDILQDAMTAPSSLNLQPWRFVVIDTEEGKELIKPLMMFNTLQWETCSAIIAVFGDMENVKYAEQIYQSAVDNKLMTNESKEKMVDTIKAYLTGAERESTLRTVLQDCGYVGMQIMLSAKTYGYDTNPIGGYEKAAFTKALGVDEKRYVPAVVYAIGKSDEAPHDSIRFSVDDITQWK